MPEKLTFLDARPDKPILRLKDLVNSYGFKSTPSPIFDPTFINFLKIKCKGCQYEYPNGAIKKHLFTYYKCNEYYEKNEKFKKELNQILKERNLEDTSKIPKPNHALPIHCRCFSNSNSNSKSNSKSNSNSSSDSNSNLVETCYFCEL